MRKTLAQQHLEFKMNAIEILSAEAHRRLACSAFETAMERAGLHGRDSSYGEYRSKPEVRGERTRRGFERWKRQAEQQLYTSAHDNSLRSYENVLVKAGFARYAEVFTDMTVQIEGNFSIPMKLRVPVGEDPKVAAMRRKAEIQRLIRSSVLAGSHLRWTVTERDTAGG